MRKILGMVHIYHKGNKVWTDHSEKRIPLEKNVSRAIFKVYKKISTNVTIRFTSFFKF